MKNTICRALVCAALTWPLMISHSAIAADAEQPAAGDKAKDGGKPAETQPTTPQYPSSEGNQVGDHLKLTVDVYGFTPISGSADNSPRCAGKGSRYSLVKNDGKSSLVKFYHIEPKMSADTCPETARQVAEGSIYEITNTTNLLAQSKTAGIAYGVLAVPFKFRLGSDKKLISSATFAPYIAGRLTWLQGFGYELMPVWAAGVGLVPVPSADGKSTETKSAFSSAIGFTLSSVKDPKYSAGIVYGRDFVSKSDRGNDPGVSKPWLSLWLGVAL